MVIRFAAPAWCSVSLVTVLLFGTAIPFSHAAEKGKIRVLPHEVLLSGPESSAQMLVWENRSDGPDVDLTHSASYRMANSAVAKVGSHGQITPVSEGATELLIQAGEGQVSVPVKVTGIRQPAPISFRNEVIPILTKAGCNSGGCHGKAEGKNGFKLSVFGFDPVADHEALTKEARGRRVNPAAPQQSLLLKKATGATPHGGGRQIERGSASYRRLLRWIREGAALGSGNAVSITSISVEPASRLLSFEGTQQLRVVAHDSSDASRDVTTEAQYESNSPAIASVEERGLVEGGKNPGEAAILVRYMNQVAVCRINMPRPNVVVVRPPEANFVDRLVWDNLQRMGIEPSPLCDDATFLRRVYLDTIGTLPTADEARRFLDNPDANKRDRLIDELLERREYAAYWTLLWSDLLRVDANALGAESSVAITRWLRRQFEKNRPYNELVRELLTARGSTTAEGPAPIYTTLDKPAELASSASQLFLGVRIECAQCHHHPFERWSQRDFAAFAGFFTGVKRKKLPDGSSAIVVSPGRDLKHPRSGEVVPAAGLGAEPAFEASQEADTSERKRKVPSGKRRATATSPKTQVIQDRRQALVDWMTDESNPFFARALANRLWAHYFGRGLVEPVDDMRATNPATNEPLLGALTRHLREVDYDIQAFTRTILRSRVYQLSSQTNNSNANDDRHFSHALNRPLPAEVLLDAVCQVTGIPEKFNGWPAGVRAIEVWDNRMPSYFFRIFGRPARTTVCACERGDAPTISQALHLMNSPEIAAKIQHRHGTVRRLADSDRTPQEIIETLYLATLSRRPTAEEQRVMLPLFEQNGLDRRIAAEDVLWTLVNTKEFLLNH